jgi:hypothetical protein
MVLRRNDVTDRSKFPRSAIGIPTGLRYKHYLNLSPYGLNIASRQAGTEYPDQVRESIFLSLLQQGREYAIHSWTSIWGAK